MKKGGHGVKRGYKFVAGMVFAGMVLIALVGLIFVPMQVARWLYDPKKGVSDLLHGVGVGLAGAHPVNVLLIANNARDATNPLSLGSSGGQADILMVAHVDPNQRTVTLISIPRDTLIALPDWNIPIPKIKSVFTLGLQESPEQGPQLTMQMVERMTGLPIQHYIVTDFQGFIDAINAIGGIEVNVPARLYDPEYSGVDLQPGRQMLNGEQALAYIRVRQNQAGNGYRVNDFQRQQAEMEMLETLKAKLLDSAANPTQLLRLVNIWKNDVVTDMQPKDLVGLGMEVAGAKVEKVTLGSLNDSMDLADAPAPGLNKENYLTGAYYDVLDPQEITVALAPFGSMGANLGLPPMPDPHFVHVTVHGSASVAQTLRDKGFQVSYGGPDHVGRMFVYYPSGHMPWGWVVARALGDSNAWVAPSSSVRGVVVYTP